MSEGKKSLVRTSRRFGDRIKIDLKKIEFENRDWIYVVQNRIQ
jgi:hypothetical protein